MNVDFSRDCSSYGIMNIISLLKSILNLIHIIVPILLLIFLTIKITKLIVKPDDKKSKKGIINMILATIIIFFIPTIINAVFNMIGPKYDLSTCWINTNELTMGNSRFISVDDRKPGKVTTSLSDYEKGEGIKSSECSKRIALLAVELAGTATPDNYIKSPNGNNYCAFNKSDDPRLSKSNKVHDSRVSCNHAYASCTQAAATVIDAAVDPEINWMGPAAQWYYLAHSSKWKEIKLPAGKKWKDVLQPGDVGETMWDADSGHSWIYVGNEVVRKKFPKSIGDLYQAGYSSCKNPHIDNGGDFVNSSNTIYHYFRFIGDCSEAEKKNVKDGYGGPKAYSC